MPSWHLLINLEFILDQNRNAHTTMLHVTYCYVPMDITFAIAGLSYHLNYFSNKCLSSHGIWMQKVSNGLHIGVEILHYVILKIHGKWLELISLKRSEMV